LPHCRQAELKLELLSQLHNWQETFPSICSFVLKFSVLYLVYVQGYITSYNFLVDMSHVDHMYHINCNIFFLLYSIDLCKNIISTKHNNLQFAILFELCKWYSHWT